MYGISIMGIKVEGHTHLIRDEESHAIINTDVEQYRLTMRRRQMLRTQRDEINSLKNDMSEIKSLLKELINKDG
jgi:uncharacterized membrane protein YgaE (UPF0421/DUF939 family)